MSKIEDMATAVMEADYNFVMFLHKQLAKIELEYEDLELRVDGDNLQIRIYCFEGMSPEMIDTVKIALECEFDYYYKGQYVFYYLHVLN